MKYLRNNRGFSLVEILTSVVILGLVATVFFQFFIFSQKTTTGNKEKLVTLNVAQMVLERIKYNLYPEVSDPENFESITYPETYKISSCSSGDEACEGRYEITINNNIYSIEVIVGTEESLGLHPVEVWVFSEDGKTKSSVEGFVELCAEEF